MVQPSQQPASRAQVAHAQVQQVQVAQIPVKPPRKKRAADKRSGYRAGLLSVAIAAAVGVGVPVTRGDAANGVVAGQEGFCTATAQRQLAACLYAVRDDLFSTRAICLNLEDVEERQACYDDATTASTEGTSLCGKQLTARKGLCAVLGEDRYDPDFEAEDFDSDFRHLTHPNQYLPLAIGNHWTYGGSEDIEIEILDKTKLIDGVTCIVQNDRVSVDGAVIEDTDDWFAQAKNGDVWYCGEAVKDFESFAGDRPREPELVKIDGSFKAGRDGDKPGITFLGAPRVGSAYRQEFSAGNAEDAAIVLSTTYSYGRNPTLDQYMPAALAQRFCSARNCVVTSEATPLDPAVLERKYFAPGVGQILSVHLETGESVQLTGCNFDARCNNLPTP